jgi:hypothetical protein
LKTIERMRGHIDHNGNGRGSTPEANDLGGTRSDSR